MIYLILWIVGIPTTAFLIGYFRPNCEPVHGTVSSYLWPLVILALLLVAFVAAPNGLGCWLQGRRK